MLSELLLACFVPSAILWCFFITLSASLPPALDLDVGVFATFFINITIPGKPLVVAAFSRPALPSI